MDSTERDLSAPLFSLLVFSLLLLSPLLLLLTLLSSLLLLMMSAVFFVDLKEIREKGEDEMNAVLITNPFRSLWIKGDMNRNELDQN